MEGVQVARSEPLELYPAHGRDKVNLNLGFMLGPCVRPDLRPQTGSPVLTEKGARSALGRRHIGTATQGCQ
jgi:hypothetical protein